LRDEVLRENVSWPENFFRHQMLQGEAGLFIIVLNMVGTFILLKLISLIVPLRMNDKELQAGDTEVHGEEAYSPH